MVFYHGNKPLTFAELKANPGSPTLVWLKIDNQKNGQRGQIISQQAISIACCPVKACVAWVLSLLQDDAPLNTPICAYKNDAAALFQYITNADILKAVREAIKNTEAIDNGYKDKLVGSHSLRSGGAMALFNQGADATFIMKMGRWTSTTFMTYIHEQVDVVSCGAAAKMSLETPFINLDTLPADR